MDRTKKAKDKRKATALPGDAATAAAKNPDDDDLTREMRELFDEITMR
jgi:hypothetical protein